ncbi:glucose 1-dehydrogenase [Pseudochrobactrum sp. HB0163]|uniref:glucose 1-dehydrogenase n=1 Tax=Pseudochrobactrum sp. HB0163 TaxID=3450708 RepID=UPI003F6E04C6
MARLKDKIAIVTGAGSGFGAAIARRFAQEGAKVVVADINSKRANDVASAIGQHAVALAADVSRKDDMERLVGSTLQHFGRLDIMVNNAGFAYKSMPLTDVPEDSFDLINAVNMKALYFSSLAVVPVMRKSGGGSIINMASISAKHPRKGLTWFNASKGWVLSATKSMALELAEHKIRVNAICPVESETETLKIVLGLDTQEAREEIRSSIPLGRLSSPEDVANAALWLAGDEAAFVTGTSVDIDGGYSI